MAGNPNARAGLAKARLAYLYGVGAPDPGQPCRNKAWLLEVSTVDRKTLDKHMAVWESEMEKIARSAPDNQFGLALREGVAESHLADVEWLRSQMDQLKNEVDNIEETQLGLYNLLERIADSLTMTSEDIDASNRLLENYLRTSLNRQKLLSLFLSLQSRWEHSSAMGSTIAAFETSLKETAKRKAKADYPATPGDDVPQVPALAAAANPAIFRSA